MLEIKEFLTPYMNSYCYVISEHEAAIMIDPCGIEEVREYLVEQKLKLEYCILTHEHYDHISGLEWIHSLNVPVIASEICDINLKNTKKNQSRYYEAFCMLQSRLKGLPIPRVEEYVGSVDILFTKERTMEWKNHRIYLRETPGHSEGGICILIDNMYLFCGDTIFRNFETNTRILGGSERDLKDITLPWIKTLESNIMVYPGHYETFTIGEWRSRNDTIDIQRYQD